MSEPLLLIIDQSNVTLRALYAMPELTNRNGELIHAAYGSGSTTLSLIRRYQATHVVAAVDQPRDTLHRRQLSPAYKAHRPDSDPDIARQLRLGRSVLAALGVDLISCPEHEADDVAATLADRFEGRVVIASADKDLLGTITADGRVKVHQFGKERLVDWQVCIDAIGVAPDRVADLKALVGDSSDGYPGVPGIGPKMATQLLTDYPDAEAIFAAAATIEGRAGAALRKGLDEGRLSLRLARLHTRLPVELPAPWQPQLASAVAELQALDMPVLARDLATICGAPLPADTSEALF